MNRLPNPVRMRRSSLAVTVVALALGLSATAFAANGYRVWGTAWHRPPTGSLFSVLSHGVAPQKALLRVYLDRQPCSWSWASEAKRARVEAQMKLGFGVFGYGIGDLVKAVDEASDAEVERMTAAYLDVYDTAPELKPGGFRKTRLVFTPREKLCRYLPAQQRHVPVHGDRLEGADGCRDQYPEDDDIDQSQERGPEAEEEERPEDIEDELDAEQDEGGLYLASLTSGFPDKIQGDPHQREERYPDRRKDPARRGEERLLEQLVPGAGPGHGYERSAAADYYTQQDRGCKFRDRLYCTLTGFCHSIPISRS